jgi:ABC-type taurine transport system substrate-binding protein
MIARGNGLDMMLVVPSARIRPEAPDNSAIVVKANSAIQKPADLAGKRASVGLSTASTTSISLNGCGGTAATRRPFSSPKFRSRRWPMR